MQCKDIPDRPILEFLEKQNGRWATIGGGGRWMPDLLDAMPSSMPSRARDRDKLARAKMGMLIRRGLAKGCICGCRGDYEITHKGLALLAEMRAKDYLLIDSAFFVVYAF